MKKIAPTLRRIVNRESGWLRSIQGGEAKAELKALLAVARYARIWAATDPWPSITDARLNALHRALQRLDRASAGGRGT